MYVCVQKTVTNIVTNDTNMTVNAILRGYTDKQNKQAVYIRISQGTKRRYRKTQIKVLPKDWENGQVKSSHPQYKLFNQVIKKLIAEAEVEGLQPVNKFPQKDFFKYAGECIRQWKNDKAPETLRQHNSEINKIKDFTPSLNLSLTTEWLNNYKAHLFSIGNKNNTVHKSLKFVRLIIRKALREGLIEKNPFTLFDMPKYKDPEIKYLTKEQVEEIVKIAQDINCQDKLRFVATWFCIGCFSGLRFGDMKKFNQKDHIINNRLILYTSKTGTPVSMPVSPKLKALFEQVDYRGVSISNTDFNRKLKTIGIIAGVGMLNVHMSRHSCAIMWANAGISQEVVSKLLGHKDLKTTAIYFKITSLRIDEELKKAEL